ncbi:MAG: acylneuraminate cytidylyltransferase family protein [Alphaproteobacteria bacterium]|nr:acylneuraminate cytidylyltransferase family protein [Alphaproteobacteria bacterium]
MVESGINLALIPARGGSKRIPGKNIADCAGRPLIEWTIMAALGAASIHRVIVSTDSSDIAEIASAAGAEVPFLRPLDLSGDTVEMIDVMRHILDWVRDSERVAVESLVLLQPTSPLRTARHVDEALQQMRECNADTIVSVAQLSHIEHPAVAHRLENGILSSYVPGLADQTELPSAFMRNGPAILANRPHVIDAGQKFGERLAGYVMPRADSVDIDEAFDLKLASLLLEERMSNDAEAMQ